MKLEHLIRHFQNKINHLSTPWRTHSCVPRRDSSRRLLVNFDQPRQSVETSLDSARKTACATKFCRALSGFLGISFFSIVQPTTYQIRTPFIYYTVHYKKQP